MTPPHWSRLLDKLWWPDWLFDWCGFFTAAKDFIYATHQYFARAITVGTTDDAPLFHFFD
jgi:hypothetical protein